MALLRLLSWSCFIAPASASLESATCSVEKGCGGCTFARIVDGADAAAVGEAFAATPQNEPVVIRGASNYWPLTKTAMDGWSSVTDELSKKYGKAPILLKTSAHVAQFGGAKGVFAQNLTLKKYLKKIETGTGVHIAFQAESDVGAKIADHGLYDLKFKGTTYFHDFIDQPVISFGGDGDGLPFHTHGETVLGLVTGAKQWLLMAPEDMTEEVLGGSFNVTGYLDQLLSLEPKEWPKGMHYCEQLPGDALFVPFNWWHATKNVGLTIGLGGQKNWLNKDIRKQDPDKQYGVPDLEFFSQVKLMSEDENVVADGIASMMDAYQMLPSKLSVTYHLVKALANFGQSFAASAQLKRMHRHLLSLEKRGTIDNENLAALMAHFGEQGLNGVKDVESGLALLDDSMRLNDQQPLVWHNSGYALLQLPKNKLKARGIKEKKRKATVLKYLKTALKLDPNYEPSITALAQLGEM